MTREEIIVSIIKKNGLNAEIVNVIKNNTKRAGIRIGDGPVCPTMYIDNYPSKLSNQEIAKNMMSDYHLTSHVNFDVDDIVNNRNIIGCLVKRENNQELLGNVVHRDILDLSVIYRIVFDMDIEQTASAIITNSLAEQMRLFESDIYDIAIQHNKPTIMSMIDMLNKMDPKLLHDDMDLGECQMYIVTNEDHFNGAFTAFNTETMAKVAKLLDSDLYVIPSSIHELLFVKANEIDDAVAFARMIQIVNQEQLIPEEVLSDHLYFYDRTLNIITIVQ